MTGYWYNIIVLGDSIAYGVWDEEGGWVQRLRKYLDKIMMSHSGLFYLIYNLGISSGTTDQLTRRFESEVHERMIEEADEFIIIFEIGTNDASYVKKHGTFQVDKEKFSENIKWLINKAKKLSRKVVFLSLLPVDEKFTSPLPDTEDLGELFYKNNYIKDYNGTLAKICKTNKVMFIDLFSEFQKHDYKGLLYDGLHPNAKGHKVIYDIIKNYLIKNKVIFNS